MTWKTHAANLRGSPPYVLWADRRNDIYNRIYHTEGKIEVWIGHLDPREARVFVEITNVRVDDSWDVRTHVRCIPGAVIWRDLTILGNVLNRLSVEREAVTEILTIAQRYLREGADRGNSTLS